MFKIAQLIIISIFSFSLLVGCEPEPGQAPADTTEVQVLLIDDQMVPAELSVKPGAKIRFFISNGSGNPHSFTNEEVGLNQLVNGNDQQTVDWKAPSEKGVYYIKSVVDGKEEQKLQMKLMIEDPLEKNIEQNKLDMQENPDMKE